MKNILGFILLFYRDKAQNVLILGFISIKIEVIAENGKYICWQRRRKEHIVERLSAQIFPFCRCLLVAAGLVKPI
ncbi:MAG: hypothetical protein HC817_04505 [Saprospiraceae bacterium]|nr:hypothetical protein [Saprospiraceae bacterium]